MRQPLGYKERSAGKGQYCCEIMQALCGLIWFARREISHLIRLKLHYGLDSTWEKAAKIFKAAPELPKFLEFIGNGCAEWLPALASGTVQCLPRCKTYAKACRWDPGLWIHRSSELDVTS